MKSILMAKISSTIILGFLFTLFTFSSCKTEGCTDPKAKNFMYEAEKDDGSCDYGGCTDPNSLNFDPDAQYDDGSCRYNGDMLIFNTRNLTFPNSFISVLVRGEYIGYLSSSCGVSVITCATGCASLNFTEKPEGVYSLRFYEIQQLSSTQFDTIYESQSESFNITGGECNTFTIE